MTIAWNLFQCNCAASSAAAVALSLQQIFSFRIDDRSMDKSVRSQITDNKLISKVSDDRVIHRMTFETDLLSMRSQ